MCAGPSMQACPDQAQLPLLKTTAPEVTFTAQGPQVGAFTKSILCKLLLHPSDAGQVTVLQWR